MEVIATPATVMPIAMGSGSAREPIQRLTAKQPTDIGFGPTKNQVVLAGTACPRPTT